MEETITFTKDLIDVITYISDKLGVAVDWGSNNLVPYLQELGNKIVAYKENIAWMWVIVGIIVAVIGVGALISYFVNQDGVWLFIAVCCIAAAACIIIPNMYTVIACKTFPEKVILDYVNSIKQSSGVR